MKKLSKPAKAAPRLTDAEMRALVFAWAKRKNLTLYDAFEISIVVYNEAGGGETLLEVARKDWQLAEDEKAEGK